VSFFVLFQLCIECDTAGILCFTDTVLCCVVQHITMLVGIQEGHVARNEPKQLISKSFFFPRQLEE